MTAGWGADESGLIAGYLFEQGCAPRPVASEEAAALVSQLRSQAPQPARFLWLHFNLAHAGSLRWLERCEALPPGFFDALRDDLRSTRVERDEGTLVAVVNDVSFDFAFDASDISTLWISLDSTLAVTARHQPLRSVDRLRSQVKAGENLRSSVELLERLLRAQADVLVDIVRGVTRKVDAVEDDLLASKPGFKRVRLGSMRRLLVRLQRLLAPEPASLFRLLQHPPAW
ncbi:MAG: CorA family divalent cation transporter, partial [Ramlibacter sp.]